MDSLGVLIRLLVLTLNDTHRGSNYLTSALNGVIMLLLCNAELESGQKLPDPTRRGGDPTPIADPRDPDIKFQLCC